MRHHLALASIALAALTACGNSSSTSPDGGGGGSGSGSGGGSGSSSGGGSGSSSGGGSGSSSGGGSGSSSGGGSGSSSGGSAGDSGTDGGQPAFDPSVYQHHRNGTRDGLYIDPVFTQTAAKTTHLLTNFVGTVSTTVYAQPLYVVNGPGGNEAFLVATEDNHVTTYNATTGAIIWDVGPSVIGPYATQNPPGGSVGPSHIGITGTPYIDIGSRTIFVNAMTTPDNNATYHHKVFALSLDTGDVATNWPVDVDAVLAADPTALGDHFNSGVQNQRGALQFLNGVLYVPYGGYDGDGGNYYGSVVGFPVATPQTATWWHTTALQGGVWGPGALPTDGTSLFPITGNTRKGTSTWGGGEAVIRLGEGPTFSGNTTDYYAPSNWVNLDTGDVDLGGASEVIFDMPGATNPHLVAAGGKDGNLYILNRDNLGGIGGELLKTSMSGSQIKGALAEYTTAVGTYVAFHIEGGSGSHCPANEGGNLVVAQITQSPMAAKTVWCAAQSGLGSPMITTTDGKSNPIVWAANDVLYGWNGDTGELIVGGAATQMSSGVQGWNGPINAKGRMAVGVNGQLYVFTP